MKLTRRELLFGRKKDYSGDESGATAIEYGLITALVALAIAAPLVNVKDGIRQALRCVRFSINGWETEPACK